MYNPLIFKLNTSNFDLNKSVGSDSKSLVLFSSVINLPLSYLGFQHFLYRTKNSMNITKNLQTKNDFYYVVNPFENKISNYEDSLDQLSNHYFNIKNEAMQINSMDFYKFWEMLLFFEVGDTDKLIYTNINDKSEGFIQAIINYRQKINNGLSNDKILNTTKLNKIFIDNYNKSYPNLINNKYVKKASKKNIDDKESDIQNSKKRKTIDDTNNLLTDKIKNENILLITANDDLNLYSDNYEEQKSYILIFNEIINAIKIQGYKGNFVLKIFETFTIPTLKMIYILSSFYEEIYIYKPYFSRISNSEKYIICKKFKYDKKKDASYLDDKIKLLEKCLNEMKSEPKFIYDIFSNLILPMDFLDKFKFINIKLANLQQIMINEIIKYIKENNYFGDKYHNFRDKQIEATKWWTQMFFPPSDNLYKKNKEELNKLLLTTIEKYEIEFNKFSSLLVK
jgi:hypothetical protein